MQGNKQITKQEQVQRLKRTIQVEQSRLLELTPPEFEQDVRQHLEDNPALESAPDEAAPAEVAATGDERLPGDEYWSDDGDDDDAGENRYRHDRDTGENRYTRQLTEQPTLQDHLTEQLVGLNLNERQRRVVEYVFGSLDASGYLTRDVPRIAGDLDEDEQLVASTVNYLRDNLDPPGIAAINEQDSLLLQLERMPRNEDTDLAYDVIADHYSDLTRGRMERVADALDTDVDHLREVMVRVGARLNIPPSRGYSTDTTGDRAGEIVPQFIIEIGDDDNIIATVNSRVPELQVSQSYDALASQPLSRSLTREMNDKLRQARELARQAMFYIEMVKMRQQTLLRIIGCVVRHQRAYLLSGIDQDLQPLTQRDVAHELGIDTSTVSRATKEQYADTPWGIKPMKFFFSRGTHGVMNALQDIIDSEDPAAPVTDDDLAERLTAMGYDIKRRTVTKYRKLLGIPSSVERAATTSK